MADRYLFDTDIVIEYLRGSEQAGSYFENLAGELLLSTITVAELWSGVKGKDEEHSLEQFLLAFDILPVDADVARLGGLFRRQFGPSHGTGLGDALIAATAQRSGAFLVSFNRRHYPMLTEVTVPYKR